MNSGHKKHTKLMKEKRIHASTYSMNKHLR